MSRYVFLNPDGTEDIQLHVIVNAPTGVIYAHQCGGLSTEQRTTEGYLIPLGGSQIAERLSRFFKDEFKGYSFPPHAHWTADRKAKLSDLISEIPCWLTSEKNDNDRRDFLMLNEMWFDECTEGWVPVHTPYGPGVLVFKNCD